MDDMSLKESAAPHLELGLGQGRWASPDEVFLVITKAQLRNITHLKIKEYVSVLAGSTFRAVAYTCMKTWSPQGQDTPS